jgi:hypothetical protein
MMNTFQTYLSYGLSVIPCNGKIPSVPSWKKYQETLATTEEAGLWVGNVACICGRVSGGLVCIDFDVKNGDRFRQWAVLVQQIFPEIIVKLVVENTPSGGKHVIYRTPVEYRNTKLACNADGLATIETRGEGGYFVCTPSEGYHLSYGQIAAISTLSAEEHQAILSAARSLNEKTKEEIKPPLPTQAPRSLDLSPFDDYDSRPNISEILCAHGWTIAFCKNDVTYFKRPGKTERGISASWNHVPNRLYVFTTSTQFENEAIYKASAVYAILEHGGDYSSAAYELSQKGYGKQNIQNPRETVKAKTLDVSDISNKLIDIYHNGYKRGKSTGWKEFDKLFSIIKGQLTVFHGMPSHGKSEFVDALNINMAVLEGWKFAVFAPENYPPEMHYHKLIEKYVGKPMTGPLQMTVVEMTEATDFINDHFFFIDASEDDIDLESILAETQELINTKGIDGLIIDPWNEIELLRPREKNDSDYVGDCLRKCRKFARRNNIHLSIVAHPLKMQKDKNGNYPVPELYDIMGSSHWRNKADNGICVFRHFDSNMVEVITQKIKYRYVGKMGTVQFNYDLKCGRYTAIENKQLEDRYDW